MRIKPLAGYVLVEPTEAEEKTASGILLPDAAREKPAQGKVISVGTPLYEDGKKIVAPVNVGDVVIYKKWGGDEIKIDGKDLKLVKFDELMGIVGK
ncbi:MAG: co-chaperone GroES [Candidatus Levybacteria bacterium]|nr:co-chaperone GroES [Candidatus Levybacteria bacterium]